MKTKLLTICLILFTSQVFAESILLSCMPSVRNTQVFKDGKIIKGEDTYCDNDNSLHCYDYELSIDTSSLIASKQLCKNCQTDIGNIIKTPRYYQITFDVPSIKMHTVININRENLSFSSRVNESIGLTSIIEVLMTDVEGKCTIVKIPKNKI